MADQAARLSGRVALVTGASRGIGRAIASTFAGAGARVVVHHSGRDATTAEAVVSDIARANGEAFAIAADVADPDACAALVEATIARFGRLDVLVNNAGVCPPHEFLDLPLELWQEVQDVNYRATFILSQLAARHMVAAGRGGRIIAVSSISAVMGGSLQSHYAPTKAAVASLMQSIAIPLGPHGITCNAVLPGAIESDMTREGWADPGVKASAASRIPLGRVGTGDDVAGAVLFLASDDARYVTGSTLLVDGGLFAFLH